MTDRLVLIRYYDHVEFRRMNYNKLRPLLREVIGWIVEENEDHIIILSEKAATNNPQEIARLRPSGFVILRSTIKEVVSLDA